MAVVAVEVVVVTVEAMPCGRRRTTGLKGVGVGEGARTGVGEVGGWGGQHLLAGQGHVRPSSTPPPQRRRACH
jgi:hypothetical protein